MEVTVVVTVVVTVDVTDVVTVVVAVVVAVEVAVVVVVDVGVVVGVVASQLTNDPPAAKFNNASFMASVNVLHVSSMMIRPPRVHDADAVTSPRVYSAIMLVIRSP